MITRFRQAGVALGLPSMSGSGDLTVTTQVQGKLVDLGSTNTGFTGDLGYELWTGPEAAVDLWDRLMTAGRLHGLRAIANVIVDQAGTPWMSFGSFWSGIKMIRLDLSGERAGSGTAFQQAHREPAGGIDRRQHRRQLIVMVEQIVRLDVDVPVDTGGVRVDADRAVGVIVGVLAARPVHGAGRGGRLPLEIHARLGNKQGGYSRN